MTGTESPRELWERAGRGELLLIDLRPPAHFAAGHIAGALNVAYSERGLAERIAVAAPHATGPVALVAADPAQATAGARQLAAAGRHCLGTLPDDPAAWQAAGIPVETLAELTAATLATPDAAEGRLVLDVREPLEWAIGYVPGALLIPLGKLRDEIDRLPRDREIAVICEAGVRSATAASILRAAGFARVANVVDGTAGYRQSGRPLAYPDEEEGG